MATLKSKAITNRDATPRVPNNPNLEAGLVRASIGTVAGTTAEDTGHKLIMCSVPSNARVVAVYLSCDAISTTGATDVGIYETTANGGAVVDADFFASAVVLTSALARSDVTHESGVYGVEDVEKPLWEALAKSADTNRDYDVVCTLTADLGGAGDITLEVLYVQ